MQGLTKAAEIDPSLPILLFLACVAFILLFILARLLRGIIGARVRRIPEFGMDFDVVAEMSNKGLLTPDEANRVKAVLTRHFSRLQDQLPGSGPATAQAGSIKGLKGLEGQLLDIETEQQVKSAAGQVASSTGSGTQQQANGLAPDPDVVNLPADVQDMHRMGMITDEEFEALKRFYAVHAERH